MKTLRVVVAVAFLLSFFPAYSNPIAFIFFNELQFVGSNWVIEALASDPIGLGGLSLRSNSGIAFFRASVRVNSGYSLITQDSLQSPLSINAMGDSVVLGSGTQRLNFGNTASAQIPGPRPGQSICFRAFGLYYLDNSPTLGHYNDTTNAMGTLCGLVNDSLGQPIPQVRVSSLCWPNPVYTDSTGRFAVRDYAHRCQMSLTHSSSTPRNVTTQIWPESTVSVTIVMNRIVSVKDDPISRSGYALHQNYPNPFNPVTTFSFSIPRLLFVTLNVYDVFGKEVATLANEVRTPGNNTAKWDASSVASGVYFCRLTAGSFVQTRKMVVTR